MGEEGGLRCRLSTSALSNATNLQYWVLTRHHRLHRTAHGREEKVMGTRNLTCVVLDGEFKVAQYGQWDGYPEGSGYNKDGEDEEDE